MTQQEKALIKFFEKELSFLSSLNPDNYDDLEVLHKDVLQAANCSIAISQMKIADALDTVACHICQVDGWLEGVSEELGKINASLDQIDTTLTTQLG